MQRTKPLNFDCVCVCIISEALKRLKKTHLYFSHDVEMWSALFEMSPSICLSSAPNRGEATYVVRVFLQVLFCVCLLQMCSLLDTSACFSQCVCVTDASVVMQPCRRSNKKQNPAPALTFWRGGAAKAVGKFLLLIGL